ncbi:hypothetical protein W97_09199 [Coniosporium apollinis CBS 100218]|uniref:Methyltransferase type 11 domain-containing protein n=1 Tax=Coniosporium apollinis (strain CBS 100218) TaxID=1168221 RepID=R7Z7D4_CONA1|nr:uncharacterized protein W97_09199 [Coniosporium apollinis CBS 100218]EON69934.1 hypothetical protein W97_09199 [Coniosporium apollinis CBS 100218]
MPAPELRLSLLSTRHALFIKASSSIFDRFQVGTLPKAEQAEIRSRVLVKERAPIADRIAGLSASAAVGSLTSISEPIATPLDEWMNSDTSRTLFSGQASSDWDVLSAVDGGAEQPPDSIPDGYFGSSPSRSAGLTQFQRFIRRMEGAGSATIFDRLKEVWTEPLDEAARAEMELEKHLWVLTALQLQSVNEATLPSQAAFSQLLRFPPLEGKRNILQLYGNLAEVYLLSAIHPHESVNYLTNSLASSPTTPLPHNVSTLSSSIASNPTLPYASSTIDHIRTTSLPALVSSSSIPLLLKECHRVLAPGGILELRLIEAAPKRATTGPAMKKWLEERLIPGIESSFRSTRPSLLVPKFVKEAGFSLLVPPGQWNNLTQVLKFPAAPRAGEEDVDAELAALVGRALWKDVWGTFVEGNGGWWWELEDVITECREFGTVWECGSLFAFKE